MLQHGKGQFCLGLVDAPEGLPHKFLAGINVGGINPSDGQVVVENAPMADGGCRLYFPMIEPI